MRSYTIHSTSVTPSPDSDWNDPVWKKARIANVAWFHAKSQFTHPKTAVKMLHDAEGLHLLFRVEDRHVIARCTRYQQSVCVDSCVEFFVEPPGNRGYFNFEFNASGTLLLSHITDPTRTDRGFRCWKPVPLKLAKTMRIHASFNAPIRREVPGPITWSLQAFIPFSLFEAVIGPVTPVTGKSWRGNFYKCGSEYPHYACWSPVDELNFHQPQFFGSLAFAGK